MTEFKSVLLLIFSLLTFTIFSQEIVTDRPDQTESAIAVGKNNFQIESGILYQKVNNSTIFNGPSTLLRYGILNGIELRFFSQYESHKMGLDGGNRNYSGFSDLEIGTKIQILNNTAINTEIAFLSHIILPSANSEITTNNVGVINKLAFSHSISDKIGLGYNIGYDFIEKEHSLTYSVALGIAVSKVVGFYIEPYGAWAEQNKFESNFDIGLTLLVNENFQLDASYGTGLNSNMNYVSVGFSWFSNNFLMKSKK